MTATTYAKCRYCGRPTRTESTASGSVRYHYFALDGVWLYFDCQA